LRSDWEDNDHRPDSSFPASTNWATCSSVSSVVGRVGFSITYKPGRKMAAILSKAQAQVKEMEQKDMIGWDSSNTGQGRLE